MTAFVELTTAENAGTLADLPYRKSLVALKRLDVRDEALQSPVGRLALSWAAQFPPLRRMEARALRAIAVQADLRTGRIGLREAELLAYGSENDTVVSLEALSARAVATARPVFTGTASDSTATAARAMDLLEDVLGPVVGLARPYVLPLWADAFEAPEWPEGLARRAGAENSSGLSDGRVRAARVVWSRRVRPAPLRQTEAARLLAVGTLKARGWLVLLANRDPLPSITWREAGTWGRLAWLSDPTARDGRAAVERARRGAQSHWRGRMESGLAHEDPYAAIRHALEIAA